MAHWPAALPHHLTLPQTDLFHNAEVSAARLPDKPFIGFYDTPITFREFRDEAELIASYLQHDCGVKPGDRVLLYMQSSPQWILAFHGVLRANAGVVPVNPMNRTEKPRHYAHDTAATTAFVAQELFDQMRPLPEGRGSDAGLQHRIVGTCSDYLWRTTDRQAPELVAQPRHRFDEPGVTIWCDMLVRRRRPGLLAQGTDDLAVMPCTSGTTGAPKGCMHTHRSVMSTLVGGVHWFGRTQGAVYLTVLPLFHGTGMSGSMNGPLRAGATIVVLPRWDREAAARCMQRYRDNTFPAITTIPVSLREMPPGEGPGRSSSAAHGSCRATGMTTRPPPRPSSRSTAGASCAPATSPGSTRMATSSWSTGSSG
jgi:fatty-acyl-CoA synthase